MFKTIYCIVLIILSFTAKAQRFTLSELINIYGVVDDPSSTSTTISNSFNSQQNWSAPTFKKEETQQVIRWNYVFNGTIRGAFSVYKSYTRNAMSKLAFQFSYSEQYEDYRSQLTSVAKLINVYSEEKKEIEVYELERFIFILTVYPASMNMYYNNGYAAPYYKILIQHRGYN
jgi:hypothetical protein